MIPIKDFCTSAISNQIILSSLSQKQIIFVSIAMTALSRCLPAITRSNWHRDGEAWYGGRWFAVKSTVIPRIGMELGLLFLLKKQGCLPQSIKSAIIYSVYYRISIGTFFLEPIVRKIASSMLSEKKFDWFEHKFLVSPEQKAFHVLYPHGSVDPGKDALITLAIPAITWTLAPLPVLGLQLIFFIFLIKAIAQEAIQKLRC